MINEEGWELAAWGLPIGSILLGWFGLLLLFPAFLGVGPGLAVASAGSLAGLITLLSHRTPRQKVLGCVGCLGLPGSIAYLIFRPEWLENLLAEPWAWLFFTLLD